MIREIDPTEFSVIEDLFDNLIEIRKSTQSEISEETKIAIMKAHTEGEIRFLAEFHESEPVGFVMFAPKDTTINLFHTTDNLDDANQIVRDLFDSVFTILSETLDMIRMSGPSITPDLSSYIVERGFQILDRKTMKIFREKIDTLPRQSVHDEYRFETYDSDDRDDIAELMFRANVGSIDSRIFPAFFGSKEGASKLMERSEEMEFQPYSKMIMKDNEYVGVCIMVNNSGQFGYVVEICVDHQHRRKGLARALLTYAIKEMVSELDSLENVTLDVAEGNPAEILYRSLGFEIMGERTEYVWSKSLDV